MVSRSLRSLTLLAVSSTTRILVGSLMASIQHSPHGGEELLDVDGLRLVAVEPGGHDLLSVLRHGRGGDGDDRRVADRRILADLSERDDAVDPAQLDVHQD